MRSIGLTAFWGLAMAGLAWAAEPAEQLDVEGGVELTSSYVWRGEVVNDEPCFQPTVDFTLGGAALRVWGTWDLRHTAESSARTRMDIAASYALASADGRRVVAPALIAYVYQDDYLGRSRDTFEVALKYHASFPYAGGRCLIPTAAVHYGFNDIEGVYIAMGLRHGAELVAGKVDFDMYGNIGWGSRDYVEAKFSLPKFAEESDRIYTADQSAFLDLTIAMTVPLTITDRFVLTPGLKYMRLLDSGLRNALENADMDPDNFGGSLALNCQF
ncbi:MAG: hypothetical protein QME60_03240 [Verrucomicrobiota bacterium]|nr:hypothetical protein [Verrucomicrobiota bacterium]